MFNCEEKILESAATHEKELTEAEKNMDFEANEMKKDLAIKFAKGYRAGFEAAKSGGPAEPPTQND